MLSYRIPKKARYIQASASFTAPLSVLVDSSIYDFSGQDKLLLSNLAAGSFYLIDSVNISGDVSEAAYISSLVAVPPNLIIKKSIPGNINLFEKPFPIANFSPNIQISAFTSSDQKNNNLMCTLDGRIQQSEETFGKDSITLSLSFAIYAMDSADFSLMWNENRKTRSIDSDEKLFKQSFEPKRK